MDWFYGSLFGSLIVLAVGLELRHSYGSHEADAADIRLTGQFKAFRSEVSEIPPIRHAHGCQSMQTAKPGPDWLHSIYSLSFLCHCRNNYLLVYSLMMAGDWLQGPYIYVRGSALARWKAD